MPSLTATRDAAVALLKTAFPELPRVEAFAGEVDVDSVSVKRLQAGVALFVTAITAQNAAAPDSFDFDLTAAFGAIVVAANKSSPEAGEQSALAVAEKTALAIHGQTFGLKGVGPAKIRAISAETDEALAKSGLYVWSVLWEQHITFGE